MTKDQIAIFGHAFFDGKKLQHRPIGILIIVRHLTTQTTNDASSLTSRRLDREITLPEGE